MVTTILSYRGGPYHSRPGGMALPLAQDCLFLSNVSKIPKGNIVQSRECLSQMGRAVSHLSFSVLKGFQAKSVLRPFYPLSKLRTSRLRNFRSRPSPYLFPNLSYFTEISLPNSRNHRCELYSTKSSIESCSSLLSAGM